MSEKQHDSRVLDQLDDRRSLTLDRREFIGFIGAALAASACGDVETRRMPVAPPLPENPFTLGVASGDPVPLGVTLWTRLAPAPIEGGGMPDERVPVIFEISRTEDFSTIEMDGWRWADPQFGHSVHVDAFGLPPDSWFYYRFRVGDEWVSPVGRTRTMPLTTDSPGRLRLATASCQNYKHGYYHAWGFLAREEIDMVAFLGDYIYEYGRRGEVRNHDGRRPKTLEGFRNRYALYKSDPNLQAAHQKCPWVLTWDDHEVTNDYADLKIWGASTIEEAKQLRAAAYQAYYEHMPLRIPKPSEPVDLKIYRSLSFGDLARFYVLDGRQYRTKQACGGRIGRSCDGVDAEDRTMLGDAQRAWLKQQLRSSTATWNGILQQTVFASMNFGGAVVNPDQWDGYTAERQELLDVFGEAGVRNVVVHTGDIHSAIFATLHREANDFSSEVVGVECVATSISSNGLGGTNMPADVAKRALRNQKNIAYFNPDKRGYTVLDYTPERLRAEYRAVSTVKLPEAYVYTDTVIEVAEGSLEIERKG